eukprot:CAMPEP_0196576570 /NCGR_PEP_ID=MMETSP1081-20130531/5793_1 /TAXON_ID=36882 /ORGANISM="Pyramimonas amylifera, Strain CCMP720" /LENGTH=32 /DNA_ID= /DNA_START= /DNA_END= /DNA_ORIENTATION=
MASSQDQIRGSGENGAAIGREWNSAILRAAAC